MLKKILSVGAAVLAAALSGCEDGPATIPGGWRSAAVWSSLVDASKAGPIFLEIQGTAFGLGGDALGRAAAAAMTNQLPGRPAAFTPDRAQAAKPNIRVILAFNPAKSVDPKAICAGEIEFADHEPQKLRVTAVFCDKSGLLASVEGWVGKVEGIEDGRFRRLLGQVVRDLFGSPN